MHLSYRQLRPGPNQLSLEHHLGIRRYYRQLHHHHCQWFHFRR